VKSREAARRIYDALERHYPGADTELAYRSPFELLVATILSAQSTDARVNLVTPALFREYPDARAMAAAEPADVEQLIVSTGFFRQKTKAIIGMSQALVAHHGGEVPAHMEALTKLPGVGRKTANVVLGHALGVPGLPVDRHVLRVANRLGLAGHDDPEKVEKTLCALYPPANWTKVSDLLILHGRRVCRPSPRCEICNARKDCDFYRSGGLVLKAKSRVRPPAGTTARASGRPAQGRKAKARKPGTKR
jgi:endonuclease-3